MYQPVAQNLELRFTGVSGSSWTLYANSAGIAYQPLPGIYAFLKPLPESRWEVLYVGEAENLDQRVGTNLVAHHKWERARSGGATHIATRHVSGTRQARLDIETDLCRYYNPSCNG